MSLLPGWNSIESTGWWSNVHFWFGIGCLLLLGVTEVLSHYYAERRDELVAVRDSEISKQRESKETETESKHKQEIDALNNALVKERISRTQPRGIDQVTKANIVACLNSGPKGVIYIRPAVLDAEAAAFGKQIEEIFSSAQYDIKKWPDASMSWSIPGIFMIVKEMTAAPPHAKFIQQCFERNNIEIIGYPEPKHPANEVSIAIGARP